MLHFYERINDDDDDDDENLSVNYIVLVCCHSDTICQCVNKWTLAAVTANANWQILPTPTVYSRPAHTCFSYVFCILQNTKYNQNVFQMQNTSVYFKYVFQNIYLKYCTALQMYYITIV